MRSFLIITAIIAVQGQNISCGLNDITFSTPSFMISASIAVDSVYSITQTAFAADSGYTLAQLQGDSWVNDMT
jgi:hypothetical protein